MKLKDVVAIKRDNLVIEHNFDVGGSSRNIEGAFSCVNGEEREGEFTPNVNRCSDAVDFEREEDLMMIVVILE